MTRSIATAVVTAVLVGALAHRAAAQPSAPVADPAAAAAAGKPSSDDIDLGSLGLEPGAAAFDDKLNIFGFADVGWSAEHWTKDNPAIPLDARSFAVGNLNIYLAKNLMAKARALSEIRFTFLPNGSPNPDHTFVDTSAGDASNFYRPTQWGGIVIERAYVEYDLTDHLTIRGGHWLTPYGIWNIDHGSPVIVGIGRPYIIGEQFFPEHQTGLDLFGNYYQAGFKLDYHATVSNGRGSAEAQADQDLNLALGARVELATPWGIKAGASYYRGRYTGFAATPGGLAPTYQEASWAADAQLDHGGLHLQGEIITHDRHYADGVRSASALGFVPDSRDFGFYVLAGYRFDWLWNVMPFAYYERYRTSYHPVYAGIDNPNVGLNFRPTASLVLKLQGSYTKFPDGPQLLAGQTLYYFAAQAAWVF